jgi:chloramphenicol 3-O-phosphotransferase
MRRLGDQIVDFAEQRRREVVEAAHLIAAAAGEPAIGRRREAIRVVVRRNHKLIVGGDEVTVPRAEITDVQSRALPQLVLD